MRLLDCYPIIVTPHRVACRDFWVRHLGFSVGFDSTWFTWLTNDDQSGTVAFMSPDHPSSPPGPEPFTGRGMCLELQVEDARAAHDAFAATGLPITYPLTDEPFGQRRFGFADPSGLWVDVVEQTEPAAGYWDRYLVGPAD